jgi:hypothetical protein
MNQCADRQRAHRLCRRIHLIRRVAAARVVLVTQLAVPNDGPGQAERAIGLLQQRGIKSAFRRHVRGWNQRPRAGAWIRSCRRRRAVGFAATDRRSFERDRIDVVHLKKTARRDREPHSHRGCIAELKCHATGRRALRFENGECTAIHGYRHATRFAEIKPRGRSRGAQCE